MNELLNKIDIEQIYKTITDLEGPKYPLDNMEKLNEAADYIVAKLKSYGIATEIQEFYIEGMDEPFKNIIGRIGDSSRPATLIGSHYDTVRNSPGANDNLSAVAVSLEVARVLSKMQEPPSVIIAVFTLEEGHPAVRKELDEKLYSYGLIDDKYRYTSSKMLLFSERMSGKYLEMRRSGGRNAADIYSEIYNNLKASLNVDEDNYLRSIVEVYNKYLELSPVNKPSYSVGSYKYASSFENITEQIKEVIVFDCLGWINPNSKKTSNLPFENQVKPMIQTHKVDVNNAKSNFIAVFGDRNSNEVLGKFFAGCQHEDIDMPYIGIGIPFDYDTIRKNIPDVLRSDHGIFWQKGVPGLFITDMANFRSDFYHTPADISKNINYEALKKIAMATVKVLVSGKTF